MLVPPLLSQCRQFNSNITNRRVGVVPKGICYSNVSTGKISG